MFEIFVLSNIDKTFGMSKDCNWYNITILFVGQHIYILCHKKTSL